MIIRCMKKIFGLIVLADFKIITMPLKSISLKDAGVMVSVDWDTVHRTSISYKMVIEEVLAFQKQWTQLKKAG